MLMHKNNLDAIVHYEINRHSSEVISNRMDNEKYNNTQDVNYFMIYSVGGFINLLHNWILEGMAGRPEEYAEAVSEVLLQFIRPAGSKELDIKRF